MFAAAFTPGTAANKKPATRAGFLLAGVPTGIVRRIPAPHPALERGAAVAARRRVDSLPANRSNPSGVLIPEEVGGVNKKPATRAGFLLTGVPTGIRTPVLTVKGWCPRPLDDGDEFLRENVLQKIWWSQTGSNRRPLACHASALPAELWPRVEARNYTRAQPDVQLLKHKYFQVSRRLFRGAFECAVDSAWSLPLAVRQLRFRYHAHFVFTHPKK